MNKKIRTEAVDFLFDAILSLQNKDCLLYTSWADETGSIGKAYGYQIGVKSHYREDDMDQMDRVLFDLKQNPYSRRIMTNTYVFSDLSEMHLYPCAYGVTYNVTKRPGEEKLVLNMVLNQRSQDVLAANNWNVCQYAILLMMVAQVCDMVPGELLHVIADAHIYDRHVDIIKELITRPEHPAPKVWLNPEVKDFYAFTTEDVYKRQRYTPMKTAAECITATAAWRRRRWKGELRAPAVMNPFASTTR